MARVTQRRPVRSPKAKPVDAVNVPSFIHTTVEPMEMETHQPDPVVLSTEKSNVEALQNREPQLVEPAQIIDPEKMAMMAFFNQNVRVHIHTTTDEKAEQIFEFIINGRSFMFRRGETKTVPRYVVDKMARTRPTTYTNRETQNVVGEKQIVYDPHQGLRYPFSVVEDPHPKGREWLEAVMREPA